MILMGGSNVYEIPGYQRFNYTDMQQKSLMVKIQKFQRNLN
jgi:hypothetical protein